MLRPLLKNRASHTNSGFLPNSNSATVPGKWCEEVLPNWDHRSHQGFSQAKEWWRPTDSDLQLIKNTHGNSAQVTQGQESTVTVWRRQGKRRSPSGTHMMTWERKAQSRKETEQKLRKCQVDNVNCATVPDYTSDIILPIVISCCCIALQFFKLICICQACVWNMNSKYFAITVFAKVLYLQLLSEFPDL